LTQEITRASKSAEAPGEKLTSILPPPISSCVALAEEVAKTRNAINRRRFNDLPDTLFNTASLQSARVKNR